MTVQRLRPAQRDEVVELLARAFADYPVMRFTLGPDRPDYQERLRDLVGFYTDRRLMHGWPVLGIRQTGSLVAAALVTAPNPGPDAPRVAEALARLRRAIGEAAFGRMTRFEQASDANEPRTVHYFVGMVGVDPAHRGRGHARALLDHVAALAHNDRCDGVALSTEDPTNVPMYRHLGFEVVAEADVGELHTWGLFRPCRPTG